jgi:gamma-glutamylaminecyclotransferase
MTHVSETEFRLFVYGSLLPGERDADLLREARHIGPAQTGAAYYLIELSGFPALVRGGPLAVSGELYLVPRKKLLEIDVRKEHPILFQRETIELDSGETAEAYLMKLDQVRGRRRLKVGDWRKRFSVPPSGIPRSNWSNWAKRR